MGEKRYGLLCVGVAFCVFVWFGAILLAARLT